MSPLCSHGRQSRDSEKRFEVRPVKFLFWIAWYNDDPIPWDQRSNKPNKATVTWGNLLEEEEEVMKVNLLCILRKFFATEAPKKELPQEKLGCKMSWGIDLVQVLTSQMDCNFISKSAVVFFQISLRGVKSHIDMVPWCHNGVCSKRLRLFNESEGMVDGSVILLTSWYGEYSIFYKVFYIPGGAGFLPSTVFRGLRVCCIKSWS